MSLPALNLPTHHTPCPHCLSYGFKKTLSRVARTPTTTPCKKCHAIGILPSTTPPLPPPLPGYTTGTLIIGTGIAGPALSLSLSHRSIPTLLLDADESGADRSQGYGLTLQQSVTAMRGLGFTWDGSKGNYERGEWLYSERHVVMREEGTFVGEWGARKHSGEPGKKQGGAKMGSGDGSKHNVHVSRNNLRGVFVEQVAARIRWGEKVVSIERLTEEERQAKKRELILVDDDGDSRGCDAGGCDWERTVMKVTTAANHAYYANIIVGCDGIRSRTREILAPKAKLQFLGVFVMLGITEVMPGSADLFDFKTVFQTSDGAVRFYSMPFDTTRYMWQLSFKIEEEEGKLLQGKGKEGMLEHARRLCGGWHEEVATLLRDTPSADVTGYNVYDREVAEDLRREGGGAMTCIGDAAHPMSPFKGQGANQAIVDSLELGRELYRYMNQTKGTKDPGGEALEEVLGAFEASMFKRAGVKVRKSREACGFLHDPEVVLNEGNVTRGGINESLKKQKQS